MLTKAPFDRLPLHVRIFSQEAWHVWEELQTGKLVTDTAAAPRGKKALSKAKAKPYSDLTFPPLPSTVTVTLDLGRVDGSTSESRDPSVKGIVSPDGPIAVDDQEFRAGVWQKWKEFLKSKGLETAYLPKGREKCAVCKKPIADVSVSLVFIVGRYKII